MRFLVVHAHPVETSFNRALFRTIIETLTANGHEADPLDLYAENFDAALSRLERIHYHDVPENQTSELRPYISRLLAAEGIIFVHPVWNYGYPAILKGFFDRVLIPGVSFIIEGGGDRGKLIPTLRMKKVAFVTSYGSTRWQAWLMGDPPRRLAKRWAWGTFGTQTPPKYLALYGINTVAPDQLSGFIERVRKEISKF